MRQFYFLSILLLFALLVNGCKNKYANIQERLIGKWQLTKTASAVNQVSELFPRKEIILIFTDSNYNQFSNGSMVSKGRYKIVKDIIKSNSTLSYRIVFKPEVFSWDSTRYFIGFEKEQLIIGVDTAGSLISYYKPFK